MGSQEGEAKTVGKGLSETRTLFFMKGGNVWAHNTVLGNKVSEEA